MGIAAVSLAALAISAIAWAWFLRREVARQTARVVAEETARREAALEYEVGLRERSRLAANLHDTILQTVTGIGFQLKACEKTRRRDDAACGTDDESAELGRHLTVATKMVDHAVDQLRGTVWSLRALPTEGRLFSEALGEAVDRAAAGHDVRIDLEFAADADGLPGFVAGNLLLVMQEAVHNALYHASPGTIAVAVAFDEPSGMVTATVSDDGCGFTTGSQAGPTRGHFGLAGMRERTQRLHGRLEITSSPGRGTTVRAVVPFERAAAASAGGAPEGRRSAGPPPEPHGRPLPVRTLSEPAADGYTGPT
jgi:signal transduction histidine kinase